jgi:peptide/nickel transport system permease protein
VTTATSIEEQTLAAHQRGLLTVAARRFAREPLALAALTVVIALFIAGALAHVIAPRALYTINLSANVIHHAPELAGWHLFGTDWVGADMLQRTLYGIRTTEEVALTAALVATLIGVLVGALAGYYGGWLDALLMRVADLVTAYPAVVLTLVAIVYFREAYPHTLIIIFASIMWAVVARAVRAHVAGLREQEFVDAARALGASDARIIFRHLLPNASGTVLVAATSLIGQIILIDATVEFFDYGLPASVSPSLGNLVADVVQFKFGLSSDPAAVGLGWWTWFFPGLTLVLILVCINLVGDALDDALNPVAAHH